MKKNTATTKKAVAPADVRRVPLHDEVSAHARELWENYGRPAGRDEEIWLEAERQLLGADPKVRTFEAAGSVSAPAFAGRTRMAGAAR